MRLLLILLAARLAGQTVTAPAGFPAFADIDTPPGFNPDRVRVSLNGKTAPAKVGPEATPPVTLVMLEAIRDFFIETGKRIGMKPAGGIRTAKQALHNLVLVKETLGDAWLTPDMFRIGASTLLNDVLMQIEKERTGAYQSGDYFSKD